MKKSIAQTPPTIQVPFDEHSDSNELAAKITKNADKALVLEPAQIVDPSTPTVTRPAEEVVRAIGEVGQRPVQIEVMSADVPTMLPAEVPIAPTIDGLNPTLGIMKLLMKKHERK